MRLDWAGLEEEKEEEKEIEMRVERAALVLYCDRIRGEMPRSEERGKAEGRGGKTD